MILPAAFNIVLHRTTVRANGTDERGTVCDKSVIVRSPVIKSRYNHTRYGRKNIDLD